MASQHLDSGLSQGLSLLQQSSNRRDLMKSSTPNDTTSGQKRKREAKDTEKIQSVSRPRLHTTAETGVASEVPHGTTERRNENSLDGHQGLSLSPGGPEVRFLKPPDIHRNGLLQDQDKQLSHPLHPTDLARDHIRTNGNVSMQSPLSQRPQGMPLDTSITRPVDHFTSRSIIPRSWEDAHDADRSLFDMWNAGKYWPEIGKVWRQLTGEDATAVMLASRYNRLARETETPLQGDDVYLLAATQEVMAQFKRDKWRLVSEAMARRGPPGYSESLCKRRYKELAKLSPKTSFTKASIGDTITPDPTKEQSFEEQNIGVRSSPSKPNLVGDNTLSGSLLGDSRISKDPEVNGVENDRAEAKQDSVASAPNNGESDGTSTNGTISHGKSGFKIPNPTPVTALQAAEIFGKIPNEQGVGVDSRASATELANDAKVDNCTADTERVESASPFLGCVPEREPTSFVASSKHSTNGTLEIPTTAATPLYADARGSEVTVSLPQANKAFERGDISASGSHSPILKGRPGTAEAQKTNQPKMSNDTQQSLQPSSVLSKSCLEDGLPHKAAAICEAAAGQPVQRTTSSQQSAPAQSLEHPSLDDASLAPLVTKGSATEAPLSDQSSKPVSKSQLLRMVEHRKLNEVNRKKPWDVIAAECGVHATFMEVCDAFQEAGISSIIDSQTISPPTIISNSQPDLTKASQHHSSHATTSHPNTSTNNANSAITPLERDSQLRETPTLATTLESAKASSTPGKRGRGRPRKDSTAPASAVKSYTTAQSPDQKIPISKHSAAMKAAWARRKANGTAGRGGGPLKPQVPSKQLMDRKSAAAFASRLLAATSAHENATPKLTPEPDDAETPSMNIDPADDEPVDLLTSETMYAQHQHDALQPIRSTPPKSAKKIRGPYKKKEKKPKPLPVAPDGTKDFSLCRYTCAKCSKAYLHLSGLKYHQKHHPDCDVAPPKPDKRTDPADKEGLKRVSKSSAMTRENFRAAPVAQMMAEEGFRV